MPKRRAFTLLPRMEGNQAIASRPDAQVWLSASAGAGKTQVLTARVLRLLLNGADPESILCLTFTKAGAAEMADRVHERLGAWVTLPLTDLRKDLFNLCERHLDYEQIASARQLFAKVLDARGGGLRIQTIHSFAQTLLAAFPTEASLPVGFRPIEGREEGQLQNEALADLVAQAEQEGRAGVLDRMQFLARTLGEEATRNLLKRCAYAPDVMEDLGPGAEARVRRWLGLGDFDVQAKARADCADAGFDLAALQAIQNMFVSAPGPRLQGLGQRITDWRARDVAERMASLGDLLKAWSNDEGVVRENSGWIPKNADYLDLVRPIHAHFLQLRELLRLDDTARRLSAALMLGQDYARAYADAKRAAGAVDFNDMIRATVRLLQQPGIGDWIRYKLDQSVDHILVDEAQDTNAAQWDIVKALTEEFFAGAGAKADRMRTVFAVGDFKQAIFGFQGTDPEQFEGAGGFFRDQVEAAELEFQPLTISQSFRSSQPILDAVDAVIADLGHETMGLSVKPDLHKSARQGSGHVELFPFIHSDADAEGDIDTDADGDAEEDWFSASELNWASALAKKVRHWTTGGLHLDTQGRPAEPGDVMILLRSRSDLARLIVSRLYEEQVPVAGVDRLRLAAPIAVQDLMACVRFVLQPSDDLTLASLLVSPLIGWSQDDLLSHAAGRRRGLWAHLRETLDRAALDPLYQLLDMADRVTPYSFLEAILSGPIQGREKLIARLGEEARDPIEELLNAALQFEMTRTPSLQLFLDWFSRGDVEIKRDPSKPENAVRVMTVHGSKGLQAPIVVLADATADPDNKRSRDLDWITDDGLKLPVPRPKKDALTGSLQSSAELQDRRERNEHWRLLYVAMTRAEEYLFVGGALKRNQVKAGDVGVECWYARVRSALASLPNVEARGVGLVFAQKEKPSRSKDKSSDAPDIWDAALPDWAITPAAAEARPSRPLAPSALGVEDKASSPPPDPVLRDAARRGTLLHGLFERLPSVRPEDRRAAAAQWLTAQQADDVEGLIATALAIIDHPDFAHVFAGDALAEAPLAGVVNGDVISGAVDRLLITETEVIVVDFKTGRFVPRDIAFVPAYHKAQMAAYVALLEGIFPGRSVRAALLYTAGPKMISLSPDDLADWRPGCTGT